MSHEVFNLKQAAEHVHLDANELRHVAQRGEIEKCAEASFNCVMCGCCTTRCPAGISHPYVGLLSRRLTGKYIAPKCGHLADRVKEVNEGKFDEGLKELMQMPAAKIQELYNNREIEK